MWEAILWGLIQGLTEFLPVSSSGHLVLIPALLGVDGPDLATSAMLHLGTLLAVLVYYRADLARMARFDGPGRKLVTLIVLGTIPAAVIGLTFMEQIDRINETPKAVAVFLVITGIVLLTTMLLRFGDRMIGSLRPTDSVVVGLAQAFALIPGISRSGMTISSSLTRGMQRLEAARFAFLLGIPAIAGGGLLSTLDLMGESGGIRASTWVGMAVAAVSGYAAIALLIRVLGRIGLAPFGIYCVVAGTLSFVLL
ncbi:MAG: undecaprenyl-diphosphate phosphatase [Actinobacteria bacterium]|nr:MAG: undecaprenyl-diphosphate phosphatase [Actinomycetota bacterium]